MRNHKCRGKRVDNGEWVKGYYVELPVTSLGMAFITGGTDFAEDTRSFIITNTPKQHPHYSNATPLCVIESERYEVDPSTVGRFTELCDVDDVEVYEDDIVKGVATQRQGGFEYLGKVVWYGFNNVLGWYVEDATGGAWNFSQLQTRISLGNITGRVIGNIHEHPYLLKEVSE